MSEEYTVSKLVVEAVPKLVHLLAPLSPDDRQRAIASALILFGHPPTREISAPKAAATDVPHDLGDDLSPKAVAWAKKNGVTRELLDHVFAIDGDSVDVIAGSMPDTGKRKQTVQAYILCGVATFLKTGDVSFADADARSLCNKVGCYDIANHGSYIKGFGNLLHGSKGAGWKLTNPGMIEAAQIIKRLAPANGA
jgi:hypothetical protein